MRRILQQYPIKDWTGDIARDFFKKHNPEGETAQCGKDFTGSFRNRMVGKPVTGTAENKSGVKKQEGIIKTLRIFFRDSTGNISMVPGHDGGNQRAGHGGPDG